MYTIHNICASHWKFKVNLVLLIIVLLAYIHYMDPPFWIMRPCWQKLLPSHDQAVSQQVCKTQSVSLCLTGWSLWGRLDNITVGNQNWRWWYSSEKTTDLVHSYSKCCERKINPFLFLLSILLGLTCHCGFINDALVTDSWKYKIEINL